MTVNHLGDREPFQAPLPHSRTVSSCKYSPTLQGSGRSGGSKNKKEVIKECADCASHQEEGAARELGHSIQCPPSKSKLRKHPGKPGHHMGDRRHLQGEQWWKGWRAGKGCRRASPLCPGHSPPFSPGPGRSVNSSTHSLGKKPT